MSREECLERLAADSVGRLAVEDGLSPVIFPMNYALDGEAIVMRTAPGTKLGTGGHRHASFEIDEFDRADHTGWSVVVVGRLEEVTEFEASTWERIHLLPVTPWAKGEKPHWLRLVPARITGRRLVKR